jgi:thiol-disulfide isomerase/thioredoxin
MRYVGVVLLGVFGAGVAWGADGQGVRLDPVSGGMDSRYHLGYVQPTTPLATTRPATLRVEPPGLKHPEYAVLPLGSQALKRVFHVILDADEVGGMRKRIWVDTNGDGDLTNDPPMKTWEAKENTVQGKVYRWYEGTGQVDLGPAGKPFLAAIGLQAADPQMPDSSDQERNAIVYWRDYGRAGKVEIGGTIYQVALDDMLVTGDFTGQTPAQKAFHGQRRIYLCVDRNGNGKFDGKPERFDTGKPFNIGGVTYEVRDMTPSGDFFRIVKSSQSVAELPVPSDVAVGKLAPAFTGIGLDGNDVKVPGDFKGKVILLDFWATWCGPCMAEVPNLRDIYARYHDKGLEIVGVCENAAADRQKVLDAVKKERMTWVHIYDGKATQSEPFLKYGVGGIPQFVLLDGDTGNVLADNIRGDGSGKAVEREMRRKGMVGSNKGVGSL